MAIEKDVLDQLLAGRDATELFAKDGLIDELKKALAERGHRRLRSRWPARRHDDRARPRAGLGADPRRSLEASHTQR